MLLGPRRYAFYSSYSSLQRTAGVGGACARVGMERIMAYISKLYLAKLIKSWTGGVLVDGGGGRQEVNVGRRTGVRLNHWYRNQRLS